MKRPRCETAKCKRSAKHDDGLCDPCHEKLLAEYPADSVLKMTELEAARLAAMDAELRNDLQTIRVMDLELEKMERDHRERVASRGLQKGAIVAQVERRRRDYETFVKDLAAKHSLDPTKMSFDTDTRVLRDLREEKKE